MKQEIDEHVYNNCMFILILELLTNRISALNLQIEKITQENTSLRDAIAEEKRRSE